ncbi:glucose-6-phosphate isomerase [Anopheles sinensis]|uniref:Glucose-6-phosphate isomerase n=1 Tax=Anopheles sinensis TaxID=74873 RepID=A0A084WH01_ANOSI|nr:glucose-6-phosphate isomerase [Anopheles sinensis]
MSCHSIPIGMSYGGEGNSERGRGMREWRPIGKHAIKQAIDRTSKSVKSEEENFSVMKSGFPKILGCAIIFGGYKEKNLIQVWVAADQVVFRRCDVSSRSDAENADENVPN